MEKTESTQIIEGPPINMMDGAPDLAYAFAIEHLASKRELPKSWEK